MSDRHLDDIENPHVPANPWLELRRLTPARIALGRTGTSLPTAAQLDFQLAHAQARDAVHLAFDHEAVSARLAESGYETLHLHSAAADRDQYLQRPDLGRRLNDESVQQLQACAAARPCGVDLAVVIADGLSALAVHRHAVPFLQCMREQAAADGWSMAPVVLVEQGRVAVGDEVGELLGAKMVIILIGERPGLSSPDSLGLYFTYAPKVGLNDAHRNCISNIRLEGLGYATAAHRLLYLMREACRRKLSGVHLKDEAEMKTVESGSPATKANFLLSGPPLPH
jgi:ethanolamine ammonia-lyase small subunit